MTLLAAGLVQQQQTSKAAAMQQRLTAPIGMQQVAASTVGALVNGTGTGACAAEQLAHFNCPGRASSGGAATQAIGIAPTAGSNVLERYQQELAGAACGTPQQQQEQLQPAAGARGIGQDVQPAAGVAAGPGLESSSAAAQGAAEGGADIDLDRTFDFMM
jgi:hypothetical protein